MILINTLQDLLTNTLYLESKLNSKNIGERKKAIDLIKRGTCFLRYKVNNRTLFAPSKFIGYKANTISKHVEGKKHGSITTNRIGKILGHRPNPNTPIDKDYKAFCERYDIIPNSTGSFGAIRKYWNLDQLTTDVYGSIELPEGQKKYVMHIRRERKPRIRQIVIGNFLNKHGKLFCEACDFDFHKKYGSIGKDFIECHHTIPVSKMATGHKTKPEDLILLCSNCHRMIHITRNWLTLKQLKVIIKAQKTNSYA